MASFRARDYQHLFDLGRILYTENSGNARIREIGVEMMAMAEYVLGQQVWPSISKRYRYLATYPPLRTSNNIVPITQKERRT